MEMKHQAPAMAVDLPFPRQYGNELLVVSRGRGVWLEDIAGKKYLDFAGGIAVNALGYGRGDLARTAYRQMKKLNHISNLFTTEPALALARAMIARGPWKFSSVFFGNSGTEANETAILTARCYTGSDQIVALRHSYHGRSAMAMTLTGQGTWRLGPSQAGIIHAHNAYCYRCPFGLTYPDCEVRCAQDLEELIRTTTGGRIAGFIAEPIQGVGGYITPPKEYFRIVEKIVRNHGGIFISDEVQTGWGRTGGKWFGIEHWGVVPDIMTGAKGLGNGSPIGLTVAKPQVADGLIGATLSTFGGNPVTATAAKAVIDFIEEQKVLDNCTETGGYLRGSLDELKDKYEIIGDVRGMGLMQAIELVEDRQTKAPAAALTAQLLEATREHGLLVGKGGLYGNVIRLTPPMNIGRTDVDQFIQLLDKSLTAVAAATVGGAR